MRFMWTSSIVYNSPTGPETFWGSPSTRKDKNLHAGKLCCMSSQTCLPSQLTTLEWLPEAMFPK